MHPASGSDKLKQSTHIRRRALQSLCHDGQALKGRMVQKPLQLNLK
jgi:hypothetical protein